MSRDFKIPKEVLGRLIDLFNLDTEQKNQIFQEFNKFKPQTSGRKYIKEVSKRTKISEDTLQFFFWISSDIYAISLESAESFKEYFNNDIKSPLENEYPDLLKKIDNISDFEIFLSRMANLIDYEYYKVHSLEEINQINIGFSNIISLYLFTINDNIVLIDAGYSFKYWKNAFYKALNELQISIEDIDYCIITHEHPDHVGLVSDLKRANPDIKICIHETAHELAKLRKILLSEDINVEEKKKERSLLFISFGFKKEEVDIMMQRFGRGGMGFEYIEPDLLLKNGDRIVDDELEIVHSPGHSVGHICIHYPKKDILFSGDHILSNITPHLGTLVIPGAEEFNKKNNFENILEHYLNSLDRIDELNSRIILPGHEQIIYEPHERITAIKNHHQNRLYEISKIIQNNPLPPLQIALRHFGEDLDQMNRIMAISETLVHLDYLEFQNMVYKKKEDGLLLYWSEEPWEKIEY
ncbi:MAG: MBL fold metallo-hydrolase [Promethearchaeota archaeon]|jgi:glyoxylase-like metal-dependent hydrolase (beta-lactamase superfamily II)